MYFVNLSNRKIDMIYSQYNQHCYQLLSSRFVLLFYTPDDDARNTIHNFYKLIRTFECRFNGL